MRQIRLIILTGLTVFSISATVSATANAAKPEFLGTIPDSGTSAGIGSSFMRVNGSSLIVECGPSSGSGEIRNSKTSVVDELLENCKTTTLGVKVRCTGLTDSITGSILAKGTGTIGYELGTTNVIAALTISPEIHFECSSTLVNIKGCAAGKASPKNVLTTKGKVESNSSPIEDYTSDTGATISCVVLASVNSGTFTLASLQGVVVGTSSTAVEVMA